MDLKAHLKQLCELHGPSGYEAPIRRALSETWQPLVDSLEVGSLGSLVGIKHGTGTEPRRRIMLCAHMDEIGMVVRAHEQGYLRVSRMGGIDFRLLPGMPVLVHGRQTLSGVVGVPPFHTLKEDHRKHYAPITDLVVDVGLPADQVAQLVRVGDIVTMDAPMIDLQNDRVAGKAVDDRACVAAVTACLDALQSRRHVWDVLAVASVQEEVGGFGALTEAYRLNPDLAIALDVTFGIQPGISDDAFKVGEGPAISMGANFHPALHEAILAAAKRIEATLHLDFIPANSGTDGWEIQISRDGIPTALLNIPIRNMHSTVETVAIQDIARTGRILAEFIAGLDADFLSTIVWDKKYERLDEQYDSHTSSIFPSSRFTASFGCGGRRGR